MSMTNLTSAGQVAGIHIIVAGGSLAEMALTQLIINLRYALMGLSLSQKMDHTFTMGHRMLASYGITDEVFTVAIAYPGYITPSYLYGLDSTSAAGMDNRHFFWGQQQENVFTETSKCGIGLGHLRNAYGRLSCQQQKTGKKEYCGVQ